MRKETVEREQRAATTAIGSMFQLSLITVIVSFSTCALLVVWMMRREVQRERQRREEEHLAFAGVMANGIVHDFRNPMSAMQLDVQMLNREVARGKECRHERVRELAERVENTVERMDKVFQEFLYMSKPPSDERDAVDLGACIRECVDLLAPRLEQADVSIDLDVPPQPVLVLAYLSGLQRALMNVIINAEQASKTGDQVRIRVLKSGRVATVDVIDSGPGVPAAQRKQIFEMFTTNRPGGTGLGLFLAKTAIERCGGSIKVADAGTGGSRFQITLPLAG
jgi:signal transduction histidine kinase